jgi:hypothetical protein
MVYIALDNSIGHPKCINSERFEFKKEKVMRNMIVKPTSTKDYSFTKGGEVIVLLPRGWIQEIKCM